MTFYINQRIFSIADKYDIYDVNEQPAFHVVGEIFSWGPKIYLYDMSSKLLYFIKGKVFSFLPKYTIYRGEENPCAVVSGRFSFRPKLDISSDLGDFYVEGNLMAHNFNIYQNQSVIGTIDKPYLTWGDKYQLNISDNYPDPAFVCALVIAIDNCMHNNNNY